MRACACVRAFVRPSASAFLFHLFRLLTHARIYEGNGDAKDFAFLQGMDDIQLHLNGPPLAVFHHLVSAPHFVMSRTDAMSNVAGVLNDADVYYFCTHTPVAVSEEEGGHVCVGEDAGSILNLKYWNILHIPTPHSPKRNDKRETPGEGDAKTK